MFFSLRTRAVTPPVAPKRQTLTRLSKVHQERINSIKKLVAQPVDNLKNPVPLYKQLTGR